MSQDILLKSVVALAKGYFDKDPTRTLRISLKDVAQYINDKHPEFKAEIVVDQKSEVHILLSK